MANINIRIDENLKKHSEEICNELGMNMSTAVTIFLKKLCREKRIPFDVSLYSKETQIAMDEARYGINLNGPFDSVKDVFDDLDK